MFTQQEDCQRGETTEKTPEREILLRDTPSEQPTATGFPLSRQTWTSLKGTAGPRPVAPMASLPRSPAPGAPVALRRSPVPLQRDGWLPKHSPPATPDAARRVALRKCPLTPFLLPSRGLRAPGPQTPSGSVVHPDRSVQTASRIPSTFCTKWDAQSLLSALPWRSASCPAASRSRPKC